MDTTRVSSWVLLVSLVILFVRPPNRVRGVEVGPDADTEIGAQWVSRRDAVAEAVDQWLGRILSARTT